MHDQTIFFRLLKTPIDDKGDVLATHIAALNETGEAEDIYTLDPVEFTLIPRSPFSYWVSKKWRRLFAEHPPFEAEERTVKVGLQTSDDFQFVRAWWEVSARNLGCFKKWASFAKGGAHNPFHYSDLYLVANWENNGEEIRAQPAPFIRNEKWYFHPGITYISRTMGTFCARILPAECIFAHISPGIFVPNDQDPFAVLAMLNSIVTDHLLSMSLSRGGETSGQTKAFEVGQVQRLPFVVPSADTASKLHKLGQEAYDISQHLDQSEELSHAFCLPGLVRHRQAKTLLQASLTLEAEAQATQTRLAVIQGEIDDIVFDLYGLSEADRALVRAEMGDSHRETEDTEKHDENLCDLCDSVADEDEPTPPEDLPTRVQNLLQWCVGVAFGRWDVRFALDPTLLPPLQGPFDPLPRCAPGALVGTDSLPPANVDAIAPESWLRARKTVLDVPSTASDHSPCLPVSLSPCPLPWDGILVDDPTHPSDVVARVRGVLSLLWGDRADAIEREACHILGFDSLRDYFRDPRKGFFAFHIKRYSKSRRKAPIYWLLQSEKRNYGIWLYIHRLRPDALFVAGREYADAKVALEEARLTELRQGLGALEGSTQRRREQEIECQQKLVAEVTAFRNTLDRIALLKLPPDLNDGVTISIAPLWELVPWKEAQKTWEELVAGKYPWSTMARQMRARGLVKNDKG